jgi:hypothetical protein
LDHRGQSHDVAVGGQLAGLHNLKKRGSFHKNRIYQEK